jgi:hypothetical protein
MLRTRRRAASSTGSSNAGYLLPVILFWGYEMPTCLTFETNEPPIQYRHHRIEVSRVGRGWRASIFAPNAMRPLDDSPSNLEKSDKKEIVAQAKRVIDAHLTSASRLGQ